jgi:hypothetical protein
VPRRLLQLIAPTLLLLMCAAGASTWRSSPVLSVTEDRNGDGRPDVWRTYDRRGHLAEVAIDTNFDGRSDVHEYYDHGMLVSRESDRNFDDRIDLVQQFDADSSAEVRAVEDVDYDGTADRLVLFQDGRPVFSKWAHGVPTAPTRLAAGENPALARRSADEPLAPFDDPFQTDLTVRAVRQPGGLGHGLGFSTSSWLPRTSLEIADRRALPSLLDTPTPRHLPSAVLDPHAPRGPPTPRS